MVILTGDTHGMFDRIEDFCAEYDTTTEDIMIILGDAGINYWLDERDEELKARLSQLPITLFCIHGNHEERPEEVPGYDLTEWKGGQAYVQKEYPNLLFAEDGEIYEFNGKQAIAIGGAYSVDKFYRIAAGAPWFPTEQPDGHIKQRVENALKRADWRVDYVLSHTVPLSAMPRHAFLPTLNQSMVDNSTEKWLETIQQKLTYERWFAGHFHVTWSFDRIQILFEDYDALEY